MPYVPVNSTVFTLAYAAAYEGIVNANRAHKSDVPLADTVAIGAANGWAEAFDTAWNNAASLDTLQAMGISQGSWGFWGSGQRIPLASVSLVTLVSHVTPYCVAMIAAINAASADFASQGITPPPWGGGGTGGLPAPPTGVGFYLLQTSAGPVYTWTIATADEILPGFAPSLGLASGGNAAVEIGTPWTPLGNFTPAANASGVTQATLSDNVGNSASRFGTANPVAAPVAGGTYNSGNTSAINTVNAVIAVSGSMTQNGVGPKAATGGYSRQQQARVFSGFGSNVAATGLTQAAGNATVTGPGTAQTGQLAGSLVGNTGLFGVIAGSNNYWTVSWNAAFGGSHTFKDNLTGFGIPVTIYGPFTSVTDTGVSTTYYVATTTANVGTSNFEPYFAT